MTNNPEKEAGLTQFAFNMVLSRELSLQEAVEQLKNNAHIRTIREILGKISNIDVNDKKSLQAYLVNVLIQTTPDAKRDSVERKVRIWLKDDTHNITKTSGIQLCFALKLSIIEADLLLSRVCGETFHWREPKEIIYIYALLQNMSYVEANALFERMDEKGLLNEQKETETFIFTDQIKGEIENLNSELELEEFLRQSQKKLGSLHNTAYSLFMDFLNLLSLPELDDALPDVKAISIREIMTTYLHQDFIPRLQRATKKDSASEKLVLSALQKDIRQNWPDETTLSRMVHREVDITRKVLILLFLATDGGNSIYGDISEQNPEDVFQDIYERMNTMLIDCGFGMLDPRLPFDWMVLYCMCADESIFIDGRIQRFLVNIFPTTGSEIEFAEQ